MGFVEYAGDFVTGAAFGAALRASGVYAPAVIVSQLNATNWHMLEMFLTASGTSMYVAPTFPSEGTPIIILSTHQSGYCTDGWV